MVNPRAFWLAEREHSTVATPSRIPNSIRTAALRSGCVNNIQMSHNRGRGQVVSHLPDLHESSSTVRHGHEAVIGWTGRNRVGTATARCSLQQEVLRLNRTVISQGKHADETVARPATVRRPQVLARRRQRDLIRPKVFRVQPLGQQRVRDILKRRHASRRIQRVQRDLTGALEQQIQVRAVGVQGDMARVGALRGALHVVDVRHGAGGGVDAVRPQLVAAVVGRVEEARVGADGGAVNARDAHVVGEVLERGGKRTGGGVGGDGGAAARGGATEEAAVEGVGRVEVGDLVDGAGGAVAAGGDGGGVRDARGVGAEGVAHKADAVVEVAVECALVMLILAVLVVCLNLSRLVVSKALTYVEVEPRVGVWNGSVRDQVQSQRLIIELDRVKK